MDKIYRKLRHWLQRLAERDCPPDPLATLSLRERADLPAAHPSDNGCPC